MQSKNLAKLLAPALAALSLCLAPNLASAQSTDAAAATVTYPVTRTLTGNFKSTDGNSGTFVETITLNSATSKSDTTVYTRSKDGESRTETSSTVTNADGSRTVDYSDTEYNATAPFVSQKTITKESHGQFYGQGTYTTAAGVTGTLTSLETRADSVNVVSTVFKAADGTVANRLRLEDDGFGFVTVKAIDLDAAGKVNTVVHTRYVTSGK